MSAINVNTGRSDGQEVVASDKSLKGLLGNMQIKNRFNEVLGAKAPAFLASLLAVANNNKLAQYCDAISIVNAALIAATLDLPIDPNLGFSAIIPYKNKAQFQIMYKGFIQLALRTGMYKKITVTEVYAEEFISFNPFTEELNIDVSKNDQRKKRDINDIVGYYARFETTSGFIKEVFWTTEEVKAHAMQFSTAFKTKGETSLWYTDFPAMAKKTLIKSLLSKWGYLSTTTMFNLAIKTDQAVIGNDLSPVYVDNLASVNDEASAMLDNAEKALDEAFETAAMPQ